MNKIRMIALAACMAATLDASAQEQEIRRLLAPRRTHGT